MFTRDDIINNGGNYKADRSTIMSYTIRSSYAYKRKRYLDLNTICDRFLGFPQLFLTFSCDDLAEDMKKACGLSKVNNVPGFKAHAVEPWLDPVLFAPHFKRKWTQFCAEHLIRRGHYGWGTN